MESQSFMNKGYVQTLLTIALVGVIAALASYAYYTLKQSEGVYTGATSITIQGEGEVQVVPDIGTFTFNVMATGADAKTAQTKSAELINAILASMKAGGVEEKDVKTTNYNLNPQYTYDNVPCVSMSYCPPSKPPVISGYEVSQMVTVKVRKLDTAGDLISKVGQNGATDISGLSFTVDDEKVSKAEARSKAIADAKVKAEALAKDLDVTIVKMTGFYEDQTGIYPMMSESYAGANMMGEKTMVAPQLPVGENTVKSTVSITYEVK